jgi:signal transduction histidine kinase
MLANARTALNGRSVKRIEIGTLAQAGKVILTVADTGKGIRPEHLGRVFEPFFTTKDNWTNVGLGLSVSYRIVAEHGGKIRVKSEPGLGARFEVELPASDLPPQK